MGQSCWKWYHSTRVTFLIKTVSKNINALTSWRSVLRVSLCFYNVNQQWKFWSEYRANYLRNGNNRRKRHDPELHEELCGIVGPFFIFTIVKLKGPNKQLNNKYVLLVSCKNNVLIQLSWLTCNIFPQFSWNIQTNIRMV